MNTKPLFSPLQIGSLILPNRIFMAPLTRCRCGEGRVPTALMAEYYRQRAGAGLILSEATSINPMGVGYPDTPGLWSTEQVAGWKQVTRAVHDSGGRIFAQLWHVGRISDPHYLDGAMPVSASPIAADGQVSLLRPERPFPIPRPLTIEEIQNTIEDYRKAAQNAELAGFDGVEIHGANGYLPEQFLLSASNHRNDDFGGSTENRARFMLDAVDAACSVWGADRVGLHLSPDGSLAESKDCYSYLARQARERSLAFLFLREPLSAPQRLLPEIKEVFGGVVIANQELTPNEAAKIIASGAADAASFGRLYIANPDLDLRIAHHASLTEPDPQTFYGGDHRGYTDYPMMNHSPNGEN